MGPFLRSTGSLICLPAPKDVVAKVLWCFPEEEARTVCTFGRDLILSLETSDRWNLLLLAFFVNLLFLLHILVFHFQNGKMRPTC